MCNTFGRLVPIGTIGTWKSTVAVAKPHGNTEVVSVIFLYKTRIKMCTSSSVHETTKHVIFEAGIAFDCHECKLKDSHGELCHRQV